MRDEMISDPDLEDLGPAMLALTEKQRRFVIGWVRSSGKDAARVARAAGYSDASEGAKVAASNLLRNSKVIDAMKEEADRSLNGLAAVAVMVQKGLLENSSPAAQQKAVDSVLDRTGFARRTAQDIRVERSGYEHVPTAELMRMLAEWTAKGALPAPVIDTTAEEVGDAS